MNLKRRQLKDRITCPECKKEIVRPTEKAVVKCPYCGAEQLPFAWLPEEAFERIGNITKLKGISDETISLINKRKFDEAIKKCDEGLAMDSDDYDIRYFLWNNKGVALNMSERFNEAIKCFEKAISINTKEAEPWRNQGVALTSLGQSAEAIKSFDKALDINAQDAKAWLGKGLALNALGKAKEAIACFKKADALGLAAAKTALSHFQGNNQTGQAKKAWWKFW